jgi:hypothetical protein
MAPRYVIIDGVLQRATPSTLRWTQRAAKAQPAKEEPEDTSVMDFTDRRSDFEVIQGLDEIPEV